MSDRHPAGLIPAVSVSEASRARAEGHALIFKFLMVVFMTRLFARLSSEFPPEPVYSLDDLLRQMRKFKVSPIFRSWPLDDKNRYADFVDYLNRLLADDVDESVILSFEFGEQPYLPAPPKRRTLTRGELEYPPSF